MEQLCGRTALEMIMGNRCHVIDVKYSIEKVSPPNLVVEALAQVNSTGWTNPVFIRRVYIQPPADGIWEYDLHITPPSGVSGDEIVKIGPLTNRWEGYDEANVKGIRVYAKDNVIEKTFGIEKNMKIKNGVVLNDGTSVILGNGGSNVFSASLDGGEGTILADVVGIFAKPNTGFLNEDAGTTEYNQKNKP